MFYVYRIKNKINGKSYIGITGRTIEERWQEHLSRAQCSQRYSRLYCAIRKYGKNNFIVNMIDCVSSEKKVRKLEGKYIKQYDSYRNGYNCNYGGHGHLFFSDDLRRKISNAQKGKIISPAVKRKMSLAKKGDKKCAEHLGNFVFKGKNNPKAKYCLVRFPDGHIEFVCGIRQFCRDHNLLHCHFSARGKTKGFVLLERFTDHPEREYTQASGNGAHPGSQDEDMVDSAWQHAAVHERTGVI